jgi:transmembrane sensor
MAAMTRPSPNPTGDVHEAAALWYARMSSDVKTPADQMAFETWLSTAPEHAEAYAEVCMLAGRFDAVASRPELAALRAEVSLYEERQRRPLIARVSRAWIVSGLAAAAAAALFYVSVAPLETGEWATARGETLQIHLSDGSDVILGSDSRLVMRFRRGERELDLDRGQAFFEVAHDASRPFVVTAGGRTVTALGTAFDVRSYLNETTVTLVSGSVAIAREGEGREAVLRRGQQFEVTLGVASIRDVDASAETAWRTGMLEFDAATLTDAVREFNRSAAHSIIISDPRLANLQVSGVFRANDPQGFAAALVPAYPLVARPQSSGDVVLSYRDVERR